jgi:hypothetical protein
LPTTTLRLAASSILAIISGIGTDLKEIAIVAMAQRSSGPKKFEVLVNRKQITIARNAFFRMGKERRFRKWLAGRDSSVSAPV